MRLFTMINQIIKKYQFYLDDGLDLHIMVKNKPSNKYP
ncbi:hypothetical protein LCGC14_1011290 [marine sediment metagenome]|uniref:Uncharacterized protein n=1 Tax=marine sediment metagenome TaxID=412755 RepID=A0A0F9N0B1_9ZZZZ